MNIMVFPFEVRLFNALNKSTVSCGVRTAVGSSKIIKFAPLTRVFIISTLCFIPTEISFTFSFEGTGNPNASDCSLTNSYAFSIFTDKPFFGSIPKIIFSATVKDGTSMKC